MADADWDARLSWAFDLIADDAHVRAWAHERLATAGQVRSEALHAFNHTWTVVEQWMWTPRVKATNDRYIAARRLVLPDALWENVAREELAAWGGLPYALLYLEWEARFPDEWMAYGKSWGTKQRQLRQLTHSAATLPAWACGKLIDLTVLAVQREHRIWDGEYARLARILPPDLLHERLAPLIDAADLNTRWRAGYLLWLLDHSELPHPKSSQWRTWLARTITMPPCTRCGQIGKPILFGLPTPEARHAAQQDLLILAGCLQPEAPPRWACSDGHQWSTSDQLWQAAIRMIIDGVRL